MILQELLGIGSRTGQTPGTGFAEIPPPPPPVQRQEPRGMFGLRGTLRDIIGTLGDAFLVQGGRQPLYMQRRQAEREGEALQGFADNPLAAIERLSGLNQEAGRQWYDDYSDNQRQDLSAARQDALANARIRASVHDRAMRMLRTLNAQNYGPGREQILRYYQTYGLEPDFELPESFDADAINRLSLTAVPVDRQVDDEALAEHRRETTGIRRTDSATRAAATAERLRQGRVRLGQGQARVDQGRERLNFWTGDQRRRTDAYVQRGNGRRGVAAPTPTQGMIRRQRNSQGQVVRSQIFDGGNWRDPRPGETF